MTEAVRQEMPFTHSTAERKGLTAASACTMAAAWLLSDLVNDPTSASELEQVLLAPITNRLLSSCLAVTLSNLAHLAVTQTWL